MTVFGSYQHINRKLNFSILLFIFFIIYTLVFNFRFSNDKFSIKIMWNVFFDLNKQKVEQLEGFRK